MQSKRGIWRRGTPSTARRGATVVEYATFTALVAGVVIVALEQIGASTSGTYTSLSRGLSQPAAATPAKDAPPATSGTAAVAPPRERLWWQVPVLCGLGGVWALLVVRRRQAAREMAEAILDVEQFTGHNSDTRLFAKRQQILSTLVNDVRALTAGEVAVRHVMSSRLVTVEPTTPLAEVRELMLEKKLRHMLVCDGDRLLGIISDRDLARKLGRAATDAMTPSPLSVPPDTLLSPAVTLMMRKRISCLPVVNDGRLCGLFTTTDLIMTLQCAFQLLEKVAPHLTDTNMGAKPISLRDTFTGLGDLGVDKKGAAAPAASRSAAHNVEGGEREAFAEDADALETHAGEMQKAK
jgi:acetoin utilization protein AcuB